MDDESIEVLAREVETYLSQHPEAADTADGILRWWLPRVRLEEAQHDVQRALDLLVARGVIVERQLPDGSKVYGCTPTPDTPAAH
jgi:hypothetical protein